MLECAANPVCLERQTPAAAAPIQWRADPSARRLWSLHAQAPEAQPLSVVRQMPNLTANDPLVLQPGFVRCSACGGGGAVPCRAGAKPSTGLKSWRRLLGGLPRSLGARSRVDAP